MVEVGSIGFQVVPFSADATRYTTPLDAVKGHNPTLISARPGRSITAKVTQS